MDLDRVDTDVIRQAEDLVGVLKMGDENRRYQRRRATSESPRLIGCQLVFGDMRDSADQADRVGSGPHHDIKITIRSDPAHLCAYDHAHSLSRPGSDPVGPKRYVRSRIR
jgi:hypothetical protein